MPPECIPIHANVMTFDWSKLSSLTQFDVIMMDPPWQLATANPTRGRPSSQLSWHRQEHDVHVQLSCKHKQMHSSMGRRGSHKPFPSRC